MQRVDGGGCRTQVRRVGSSNAVAVEGVRETIEAPGRCPIAYGQKSPDKTALDGPFPGRTITENWRDVAGRPWSPDVSSDRRVGLTVAARLIQGWLLVFDYPASDCAQVSCCC